MTSKTPVSVLGLGPMGRALAGALQDAGHPTTVWNRTAARADELVSRGATQAATPAGAKELPARTAAVAQGICELTCLSRNDAGNMSTRVECTENMDARQCAAVASHRNLNDAYPANFNCSARIVQVCAESRN